MTIHEPRHAFVLYIIEWRFSMESYGKSFGRKKAFPPSNHHGYVDDGPFESCKRLKTKEPSCFA